MRAQRDGVRVRSASGGLFLVSVLIRDEPGALARVARLLAAHNINLRGLMVDAAGINLLTTSLPAARAALDDSALRYTVQEVHEVLLEDHPGTLADLCERLAHAGINIVTAFGVSTGSAGRIYINVSDLPRAAPIIDTVSQGPALVHYRLGRIGPAP
ncbi:MAG: domain pair [Thermoplasmata archaeon]|jgi:hypothetical protein|nr:domain pair [Thermoplasmata archaeon]